MKRMMYILNVNWNWIKQRPQYLAEELSQYYNVDVFEKMIYRKINHINNDSSSVNLCRLFRFPKGNKCKVIKRINTFILKKQLSWKINRYEYVWLSNALDYMLIKDKISKQMIIYDCMDDQIEFPYIKDNTELRDLYIRYERELIRNSSFVFTSAEHLKTVLLKRYGDADQNKIIVLNNGVSSKLASLNQYTCCDKKNRSNKVITYIGTISQWIDWNVIIKSLNVYNNIEYHFWGPIDNIIPQNEHLIYKGILPQEEIYAVMKNSDLLIMPFVVNDLILSVNPVKLYEYILSEVPVLACGYTETEKFSNYVYLYYNDQDFMDIIRRLSKGSLNRKSESGVEFVKNNTWEKRAKFVYDIIDA